MSLTGCANLVSTAPEQDDAVSQPVLTADEQRDVNQIFQNAQSYCAAAALGVGGGTTLTGSVHLTTPRYRVFGDSVANPCVQPNGVWGETVGFTQLLTGTSGLCRAQVNYCVGMELRLHAESLSRAPRSRAVRDTLVRYAREAFENAALESASTLALLDEFCTAAERYRPGLPALPASCSPPYNESKANNCVSFFYLPLRQAGVTLSAAINSSFAIYNECRRRLNTP